MLEKTLEKINKELNSTERIGTRSQLDIEHIELKFERKFKEKMVDSKELTISLEEAIKLIPKCNGEEDIYKFM